MRLRIFALLLITILFFTSCQKNSVDPDAVQQLPRDTKSSPYSTVLKPLVVAKDTVTGYIRIQLAKDSINTDNVLINFNPKATAKYKSGEDAPTFQGFGLVSLSSLSSDNIPLAINELPLTIHGTSISLKVNAKTDGNYKLSLKTLSNIPTAYSIWLMDKVKKDSLDLRHNPGYVFSIAKADTTTFGSQRFKLVIRPN
jgi:hypothetical protein